MDDPPAPTTSEPSSQLGPEVASYVTVPTINTNCNNVVLDKWMDATPKKRRRRKHDSDSLESNNNSNSDVTFKETTTNNNSNMIEQSSLPVVRSEYLPSDSRPYIVHVQRLESSPKDGSTLHPITFDMVTLKQFVVPNPDATNVVRITQVILVLLRRIVLHA
ncbi:unnamed protein product [Leptosia nina]|uniref:Uncharacterized protein n=1 Tax=Leptosia nina TaxID=320188 RepID=A0AAV1JUI5_9NEOP